MRFALVIVVALAGACNRLGFPDGAACASDAECDDANPCTDDRCGISGACIFTAVALSCDDGDTCSSMDVCVDGVCRSGPSDRDLDGDGFVDATCAGGNDCDDSPAGCGARCFPGNDLADLCDLTDQDCDGAKDEDGGGCAGDLTIVDLEIGEETTATFFVRVRLGGLDAAAASASVFHCAGQPTCDPTAGTALPMNRAPGEAWATVVTNASPGSVVSVVVLATNAAGTRSLNVSGVARLATVPRLFRSVGVRSAPLMSGALSGAMTVASSRVTFGSAAPPEMGVGDVLVYDIDGDAVADAAGVLSARLSDRTFWVRTPAGGPATATTTSTWSVFRAYRALSAAASATENNAIPAGLAAFDVEQPAKRDLVMEGVALRFALYADGVDAVAKAFFDKVGGATDADHDIVLFAPTSPGHVGARQRHSGRWGDGYHTTQPMRASVDYFTIDGLAMLFTGPDGAVYLPMAGQGSLIVLTNSLFIVDNPNYPASAVLTIENAPGNSPQVTARVWNSVFWTNRAAGFGHIANVGSIATFMANVVLRGESGGQALGGAGNRDLVLKNAIVLQGALEPAGPRSLVENCASTGDISAYGPSNFSGAVFSFADEATYDFHLAPGDTGATGRGANLSAPPVEVNLSFRTDIDGQPRPASPAAWDIGIDEVP